MFNKLVADLLTSHLGEYFENIDREHVKVSVWNGLVHMRNLKVRQDALRFLDVPVCVLMGTIEELTIVIPWTRLRSESVVVQIRKAQLILADKETAGYSIDQDVREARARKIRELAATDEALLMAFREDLSQASNSAPAPTSVPPPTADAADSSDSNFTARLKASILNNIRVEVEEVWVHYTSCVACAAPGGDDVVSGGVVGEASTLKPPQGHPPHSMRSPPSPSAHIDASVPLSAQQASLSFQIKEIKTRGCNERFEPAFVAPGERVARQLISFRGLAASLRTSTSNERELSLLKPFDVAVELAYQPVYTDVSTPQYMAAVRMDDACSCTITSERCTTCYGLVQYLVHVRQRQALRRLRPIGERLRANPRAWWRYTLDAVRQQVQNNRTAALASAGKLTPFSWLAYTSMKQKRDRYMRLYLRQQRISLRATGWLEPLTVDEHVELVALEDELSIDVLKLGKRLAMRRVSVERVEYEKLLREKRAAASAGETDTPSPVRPSAPPAQLLATVVKGGWFSFWRSGSQPTASASVRASGAADDGLSEEARAELRELVQLMTAEQWTDAQRAVIAQELGMSPEEAKALSRSDTSLTASTPDPATADLSKKPIRHRSVPSCVVFLHAKELRVELQSRALSAPSTPSLIRGKVAASTTAPETLAQVALHTLQAGVEWGGVSAASGSALGAAYYWGAMERFSITAASLAAPETRQFTHAPTEEVILAICRTGVQQDGSQSDLSCPLRSTSGAGSPRTSAANMAEREASVHQSRLRTFSPLESCWSIVPDECHRHAAVKVEWTARSAQQLTSRASALHCVRVGLALVHVVIDVVPLRHLSDFLFTVMWPETALSHSAASDSLGDAQVYTSPPIDANVDGDFTALAMPVSPRMTYAEQRCATDEDARLVVLRRRVEQQRSVDWSVAVDAVHISLSEVPQVQGCELALTQLCLRNDAVHRLQLQGRLRREVSEDHSNASTSATTKATAAAALGSLDTDWIDCFHVRMAAARLSVFFPRNDPSADGPLSIERGVLLPDTAIAAVVERSLLGRCHPNLPQWSLRMSSSDAVSLTWSRTSLSVLTTACTMLADLAASVELNIQERGARQMGAAQSPESKAVYMCRVRVLPHTTGKRFWPAAHAGQGAAGDVDDDAPPHAADELESRYKQLHPFSAARQHATLAAAVSLPQRVSVRLGVCVVYHAQRSTFPAQYYTLQDGCTHVLLDGENDSGGTAAASVTAGPCVHLYVSQGGRNHEEALASGYRDAKRLLLDKLKVPPALLENAFWLKRAVNAWLEKGNAVEGDNNAPSQEQVRKALSRVLAHTQAVPCRYVAFQCASDAEARAFATALRRCCVSEAKPPLLLRPSVQARYSTAVSAPELRKQPLYGVTVSFPSLRMTCEGSEPAVCLHALETNSDSADACRSPRRDAVLSFTPFLLRHDCYRDKQSYELSVATSVALCARFGGNAAHDSDVKLFDVSVPSSSSTNDISGSRTAGDSIAFFMRFVHYRRPSPLPSSRRCTMRVGPSARMCLRAGPTLLECGEAFWDTIGLLTNRLFGAEVIAGYPWWRSLGSDEDTRKEEVGEGADVSSRITTNVEVGWGGASECGGNALCTHVDVTAPALQVNVDLEGAADEPMVSRDIPVLRFKALGPVLEWCTTEACDHVRMTAESPQLQWCCPSATGAVPGKANWVTLMQPDGASTPSESRVDSAKLSVDWKRHRLPPMLSFSDWLCGRDGGGEDVEGACVMGIRDQQELKLELRRVRLLFLYPLLMHLLGSIREGLVERASAVVVREPCWFCAGALLCPPLSWRAPEKATAAVSWTHVRKSVTLKSVVLQTPRQVDWLAQAVTSAPLPSPAPHLLLAAAHLLFTDRVQVPASSSTSDQSPAATAVDIVYDIHSSDMFISHAQPSSGAPFQWRFPSWHVNIAHSVFDARCLWAAGGPRRKSFVVVLPSRTESCVLRCSSADLTHVMDVVHANFFRPTAFGKEMESDAVDASSPASLLKAVAEESTWTLSVKGAATLCISTSRSNSSHSGGQSMQCLLRLNDATASAVRSASGELSCSFAAQQVWLGCGAPSTATSDLPESDGLCILQVAPLHSAAATPAASLRVQCSWRWLVTPKVDSTSATGTAALPERAVFLSVESFGAVTATVNGEAVVILRAMVVDDRQLRASLLRYMDQAPPSASRARTPTPSHESSGGNASDGRAKQVGRIRLQHLECRIPCSAVPAYSPSSAAPTPSTPALVLSCAISRVQVELCKNPNASYAMVRVARLVRCVLEDTSSGGSVVTAIPLALEQPTEWQAPVAAFPRPRRHASPHARVASGSPMGPPKPKDASLLDELFGELPAAKHDSALPTKAASPESDVFYVALENAPMQCKVILDLQPLWLFAPSMMHAAAMLDGVCTQVKLCAAARLRDSAAPASPHSIITTATSALHRSYALQLQSGSIALLVGETEVAVSATPGYPSVSLEAAILRAVDEQEMLVIVTEAASVAWNSVIQERECFDGAQTVLHLQSISISAIQGMQNGTVLVERFGIRVQRQLMQSGQSFESSAAAATGGIEEWRLGMDALHLTLTQLHYTALLRVALQQTSFLAAIMKYFSSASQSIAAAAAATAPDLTATAAPQKSQQHRNRQTNSPSKARCFLFHLSSLRLRVHAGNGDDGSGHQTAVYFELSDLNAAYYAGQHNWSGIADADDDLNERGVSLRLVVTLASCLLGTENVIPTLAVTAASCRAATRAARKSCSLRVVQEEQTKAYRGALQAGQVTVTVEAVPMMAWVDLLYTPYLQVTVPGYQSAKERVVQQDLWLSEDLLLSERTPLRVTNKLYSLVYLYGNGHTIHMNASRHGQLIFLEEGVTLRIMNATVCMTALSIEAYVAAGNGSYVVIDPETCSVVPPTSALERDAAGVVRTAVLQMDHQRRTAAEESTKAVEEAASPRWQRFIGEVQVELRIPEPRSVAGTASMLCASTGHASTTWAQRTLVLYTDMNLCLVNSRSAATDEDELTGAFDLAHAGVRSEYCAQHGGTAVDTSDLVSDWAMKVLMTEEKRRRTGGPAGLPVRLDTIHVSASTGVEVRVRYSDAVFVARAVRHAQAAASRWQDAVRRDVWSGLSSLHRGWDAVGADSEASVGSLVRARHSRSGGEARNVLAASAGADTTVATVLLQIPYVSLFIIDDSQDNDTPLFCFYANEIHTPQCALESLHTSAELRFVLQLEYYELSRSQWAPVLEPVEVKVSFSSRKNASVMDLYDRKGYARLSTRMSSVKLCFSSEMLRNVRQLLLLRDMFESAGVDALAMRGTSDGGVASASVFHAFKMVQTIGLDVVVQLPEYVENPQGVQRRASDSHDDDAASTRARVLHVGQEWEFNLPRYRGKELPLEHQKIIVQQQQQQERPSTAPASKACGAVITLASVGVQRVTMGTSGPLQRYILADVSVPLERQGQKQVLLHTLVTFTNRLSMPLLQVVVDAPGTYDAVGVVPPASSQCVPVQVLRRRVALALGNFAEVSTSSPALTQMQLDADSIVSLGMSYDSLPCLAGTVLLCVCSSVHGSRSSASRGSGASGVARIAVGKNFVVLSGQPGKTYFLLRIQAAARQPADVLRHPSLSPLRSVIVTAEAVVTIRNAVGVPLTVTLLTRRTQPGRRISLLDTSPDTAVYTCVCSVAVGVDGSYGATEMDPLEDVCLSVSLQQPNGVTLAQWPTAPAAGISTAQHPPACVHAPLDKTRRDTKLVLVDPVTNETLVLAIKYAQREVTLYCRHWIFNQTDVPVQLADTTRPHHGDTERCIVPIAGLSGRTERTATVSPWKFNARGGGTQLAAVHTGPFLYHSLQAELCHKDKSHAGSKGLFLRLLEPTEAGTSGGAAQALWSEWSSQPLLVHEAAEVQVIVCASRHKRGAVWVLSCRVEMGHQASVRAYSDTRVVSIFPRWVLVNKSPYALRFSQHSSSGGYHPPAPTAQAAPFTKTVVSTLVAPAMADGRVEPLFSFAMCDDKVHNIEQCLWSPPFAIHTVEEQYVNLVYQTRGSLAEHWPQTSARAGQRAAQGVVDRLPPLRPEDILEVGEELFVRREEAKVFNVRTYEHKGCMMCVQVEEAVQPPLVLENRTSFTVCFRQRGGRRVSTVFPRRRKAWTWDAPPAAGRLPAEVELWVLTDGVDGTANSAQEATPAAAASCVLNFDPQQIGCRSSTVDAFQCELDVGDSATGASSLLFVRVRGVHGISYAVSITMEPTVDVYRTLPFPQLSLALHLASMYVLCRTTGKREGQLQDMLLLAIQPVDFSFVQGSRVSNGASRPSATGSYEDANEGDVQQIQLRFRSFQVDDERPSAKQRVVAQLVDDRESGFQIERKLLRITPILYCSVVAAWLTPVELHIEDGFITAMMGYVEEVVSSWEALRPSSSCKRIDSASAAQACQALLFPWQVRLERELIAAKQHFAKAQEDSGQTLRHRRRSSVPLWSRVVAIQRLLVDPLLVSLSLYRSPGAADDPLWKLAGAASLLIGSTQDSRLQWDAVQRRNVCDTIWHLAFLYRDSYVKQMKGQYMSLVNIMGLDTVRSLVSDLLHPFGDEHTNRRGGDNGGRGAVRRQKQRVPCRRAANLLLDHGTGGTRSFSRGAATSLRRASLASASAGRVSDDMREMEEAFSATTSWLLRVPERVVQVSSQRTATVAEVARSYAWHDFMAVAQTPEIRAFGGCALAHALAEMRWTPRYSLQRTEGSGRRQSASDFVRATLDSCRRGAEGCALPQVDCSRCAELEALREARLRSRERTPLPHPVHDGFLTWEEFAHHINWYEFVDMCSDEEVRTYAPLVCQGASEASCNVCILTAL
ncbi:conserved hypothetical protein [Leishmania infantum JPCM5]|uniref:N-terminal_region_of_Chorein_-_a_TM_vesicle-media ted_sorter/Protein_of_uncharacterized_function_(DUF1162)_-_ putative n=2 Tax=Leishmania infantum TaxID=5671 RepID=A0A6L0XTV5_LEIIN|nr:conserved hypothetical protein [Leishmania infantum JPCM5]CAC9537852.1 N-terminal_region_of_Chorein_-_a_TM_vesicle-mediated_sorter/Protein_of_uncharacterised_function_(DUF1162)_-_putative [Leishmania infantum]CAM71605.2 conserved hypothetical protein [Leishmania infantum JPCM5]SUZ45517.1 N-terminal_region_of_Chorein_-_a_TM_vesicle-mediated_sorter/Protein_of_uncharacterised_function_(DUF1162)_-_putative [Leishmania infantum]|eukprot:XP_001468521.2 conserved hypothetical protein [Leishmania infantum JPCM5]